MGSSTDDSRLNTTAFVAGGHGDDGINRLSRLSMRWRESRLSGMRWRESSPDNEEDEETIRRRKRRRERMMWDGSSSSDDDDEEEEEEEEEDDEEEATRRRRRRAKWKRRVQPPRKMKEQREPFPIDHLPDDLLLEILLRAPRYQIPHRCKTVCKRWNSLVSSPDFFPSYYKLRRIKSLEEENY